VRWQLPSVVQHQRCGSGRGRTCNELLDAARIASSTTSPCGPPPRRQTAPYLLARTCRFELNTNLHSARPPDNLLLVILEGVREAGLARSPASNAFFPMRSTMLSSAYLY